MVKRFYKYPHGCRLGGTRGTHTQPPSAREYNLVHFLPFAMVQFGLSEHKKNYRTLARELHQRPLDLLECNSYHSISKFGPGGHCPVNFGTLKFFVIKLLKRGFYRSYSVKYKNFLALAIILAQACAKK